MLEKVYAAHRFLKFNVDFYAQKKWRKYFLRTEKFLVQQKWKIIKSFYAENLNPTLFSSIVVDFMQFVIFGSKKS